MKSTSITDLKANLSQRIKQVRRGEPLLITDHNCPVAMIQPLSTMGDARQIARLVAEGIIRPGARGEMANILAMPSAVCHEALSKVILEEREER